MPALSASHYAALAETPYVTLTNTQVQLTITHSLRNQNCLSMTSTTRAGGGKPFSLQITSFWFPPLLVSRSWLPRMD
ncbi:hypothetical protein AVEN_91962-1 [Araneus ventricosus]|uniref:Uncharacterized protein n=1 Tax=Araneus ventricosus TaxID=182803 RepID=A0A4Y1ZUF9_ARAVE|nr:hypothetical protein AVEN_91962-1 [Araneus ventricosus]